MAEYYEKVVFVVIALALGVYATLLGHGRILPPVKDMAEAEAWKAKHSGKLRIVGPALIAIAIASAGLIFLMQPA